ncbi:hypothetical protein WJX72_002842 [[Myrmecia] bisecta]|uniref:S1 motif domain-containing protein n=1 Tax=[Myrmecia] bisecta TaxID=41462 RepID=A0AAW1R5L4_9CHLO
MASKEDLFDDAAEEESDKASDDSSEEGEDEPNDYDYDDKFLVRDEEADDNEEGDTEETRKIKRKRRRELELEEEDYQLLEDNQVTGIRRPRPSERKRIRKRVEEAAAAAGQGKTAAEQLQAALFGDDGQGLEDVDEEEAPAAGEAGPEDDFVEDDDEFDDFIDDDVGDGTGRRRRRTKVRGAPPGVSSEALREAQEIFGDVGELLDMYGARRRAGEAEEDEEPPEDLDEEAAEQFRADQDERQRQKALKKVVDRVEPEMMAAHFMLPKDEAIRTTDLPEREQEERGPDPANMNLAECAKWVYERLTGSKSMYGQERDILEDGVLEVDQGLAGLPHVYHRRELLGRLTQLQGYRGVRVVRGSDARRSWRDDADAQQALQTAIGAVLEEYYNKHYELPVIATYRKELCGELLCMREDDIPEVTSERDSRHRAREHLPGFPEGAMQAHHRRIKRWEVMWSVIAWSHKWRLMQRRKEARQKAYDLALDKAAPEAAQERAAIEACLEALQEASTMEEVEDVDARFRLVQAAAADSQLSQLSIDESPGKRRRPQKFTRYSLCKRAGLDRLAAKIGLSASQLGQNLDIGYKRHDPEDPKVPPEELAADYVTQMAGFDTPAAVLKGACHLAAIDVAADPKVREVIRTLYINNLKLSTEPTASGLEKLDPFQPLGQVAHLKHKPASKFEGTDQFLRISIGEKEGLITSQVQVAPSDVETKLLRPLAESYLGEGVSMVAQAWNALREAILGEALQAHLLPLLEREQRSKMLAEARDTALHLYADGLWKYAAQPPLQVRLPDEDEFVEKRRFMTCVWGDGSPATTLVMLDENGGLVDMLYCSAFSGPQRRPKPGMDLFSDPRKAKDAERVRDFIMAHSPHVLLVGSGSMHAKMLKEDMDRIRDHILEFQPKFLARCETGTLDVRYADETIAALWETSGAGKEELAEATPLVRRAVALGRLMLDPLPVLAALTNNSWEILATQCYPLQQYLPREELKRTVQRVLVTAVNQVGVDINAAASHPWLAHSLQYVAGLGPRKAMALLRAVQRNEHVVSRHDMWSSLGVLGNRVFRNCGPFIRIRSSGSGMANVALDALDDTRIAPQSYRYAIQIAQSALGGAAGDDEDNQVAVERAMARPHEIEGLDLEQFDRHIRQDAPDGPSKLSTLIDISFELVQPFGEVRGELGPPKDEEVFWMLTGESEETLKEGKLVEVVVRFATQDCAYCTLNDASGLEGMLSKEDISSQGPVDPRDYCKQGATMMARIKEVRAREGLITLTTCGTDLKNDRHWEELYCAKLDSYYIMPSEADQAKAMRERQRTARQRNFTNRPIRHPKFKNVSMADAAGLVAEAEVGDCILRPSPKGNQMICLTLKVHAGEEGPLVLHQDIQEAKKGGGAGPGAHLKLGTPLTVEAPGHREAYEDLDEVLARYVEPYMANIKALVGHRKMREGSLDQVNNLLRAEKARSPQQAVYCFGIKYDSPGVFYIAFIMNTLPHREYFTVTPDGYYYRSKVRKSLDHLLAEFKKHPPGVTAVPAQRSAASLGYQAPQAAARRPPQPAALSGPSAQGLAPRAAAAPPYGASNPYAPAASVASTAVQAAQAAANVISQRYAPLAPTAPLPDSYGHLFK